MTHPEPDPTPFGQSMPTPPELHGPPPVPMAPPPPGMYFPVRQTEPLAIVSLVLSVVGMSACGIGAIGGIITGHMALRRIRANPELDGEGLAKAGLIIGYVLGGCVALLALGYVVLVVLALQMGPH